MQNTMVGVAVMLLATTMTNLGTVWQKKAVDHLPPFDERPLKESILAVLRSPLWVLGWLTAAAAIVLNMVALGLADISIIQPLNGFGLVVLALFSRLYLKERLGVDGLLGVLCVIIGVVAIGITAHESRLFASSEEILSCYRAPAGLCALAAFAGAILLLWVLASRIAQISGLLFSIAAAVSSVLGLSLAKGFFGLLGLMGVRATLASWPAVVLLVLLVGFSTLALVLQQLSFQKGRAIVVTPVFAASSVVLPLISGRFVFAEQIAALTVVPLAFIVAGTVVLGARGGETARNEGVVDGLPQQ